MADGPRRGDKDREVYFSGRCQAIRSATGSACITWKNRNCSGQPRGCRHGLDAEALPAAALDLGLGILELERLVEALLDEVDQSAVDQRQAGRVDHDLHA